MNGEANDVTEHERNILTDIAHELASRGTEVAPPADSIMLSSLESSIGGELSATARALYSTFDGFIENGIDDDTMVRLWSIDEIIQNMRTESGSNLGQPIGDYFLHLDIFFCDLRADHSPVFWGSDGTEVAASLFEFCKKLAEKSCDF